MKTLLFLLLFSSAAYGQNLFTMDSSKVLTAPDTVTVGAGDTLSANSFNVYFAHTQISFLGGIGGNPLDNFLARGVTMVFLKQ